jgi:hypothetical protein
LRYRETANEGIIQCTGFWEVIRIDVVCKINTKRL